MLHSPSTTCVDACPDGFYDDKSSNLCKTCSGCVTCSNDATTCTKCSDGKYLETDSDTCVDDTGCL